MPDGAVWTVEHGSCQRDVRLSGVRVGQTLMLVTVVCDTCAQTRQRHAVGSEFATRCGSQRCPRTRIVEEHGEQASDCNFNLISTRNVLQRVVGGFELGSSGCGLLHHANVETKRKSQRTVFGKTDDHKTRTLWRLCPQSTTKQSTLRR